MDLEDLFDPENRRRKYGHRDTHRDDDDHGHEYDRDREHDKHREEDDHQDDRYLSDGDYRSRDHGQRRHGHHDDDELFDLSHIAQRLLANKKLLILIGIAILVILVIVIIFVLPLLGQAFDYVDNKGVKSVVERVWEGGGAGK